MKKHKFETDAQKGGDIDVHIALRIIERFSEGLYASPHKAVEELVSNSYDACAQNTHVMLSDDLRASDASIVVVDDGEGMNDDGLKRHWIIGESMRRQAGGKNPLKRKPIGKFGIGKLATYVLASNLAHISKVGNSYYATAMDYSRVVPDESGGAVGIVGETVQIPWYRLSEEKAQAAVQDVQSGVQSWAKGDGPGYHALQLFGSNAPDSWTISIMSGLKPRCQQDLKRGILRRVLMTAMPHRGDFNLYLNGEKLAKPKTKSSPWAKYVLGKDLHVSAAFKGAEKQDDASAKDPELRHGIYDPSGLGRVTGFVEIYDAPIEQENHGFFVYVRGRQINVGNSGFGIERDELKHGVFRRFRMIVHIDNLDDELISSRELLREGALFTRAQGLLKVCFNYARNRLDERDRQRNPTFQLADSISGAPGSVTRGPLLSLAKKVAEGKAQPFYLQYPHNLSKKQQTEFLTELEGGKNGDANPVFKSLDFQPLGADKGLAVFDVQEGKLLVNESHPFVAAFIESFDDAKHCHPLQLLIMAEPLVEAYLYHKDVPTRIICGAIKRRDDMLRMFVRSSKRRTAGMIAEALLDARNDANKLEVELCAAFEALGFANVLRLGKRGQPDGTAEAPLPPKPPNVPRHYKVSLEAKSGTTPVTAKRLGVSGIARHMEEHVCDHGLVIANRFATVDGKKSAMLKEIRALRENTGKTITLMQADDLARLVKISPTKQTGGLAGIRSLFECVTPQDSKEWVDKIDSSPPAEPLPYRAVLESIWDRQQSRPHEIVDYGAVLTKMEYRKPPVKISRERLIQCCKSLSVQAEGYVFAGTNDVGIELAPERILEHIGQTKKLGKGEKGK